MWWQQLLFIPARSKCKQLSNSSTKACTAPPNRLAFSYPRACLVQLHHAKAKSEGKLSKLSNTATESLLLPAAQYPTKPSLHVN